MDESVQAAARRLLGAKIARGYVPRALHAYVNVDGVPIYWRARLEHPDGDKAPDGHKIVRPLYLNGSGYRLGEPTFPLGGKPIYNLDKIAGHDSARVWIVEGEKAADALTKLGAVATTSGGADSAGAADWSPLRGRECVLWPDNDDAGKAYAGSVAAILGGLRCRLWTVDIEALALPAKGDAADWVASHERATAGDLDTLPLVEARVPDGAAPDDVPADGVRLIRGDTIKPEIVEWLWNGYLAAGKLHILAGRPGCGKTTLALAVASTITNGGRWPDGSRAVAGNVLIWSGEDSPADTLVPRLLANGADVSRVHFVDTARVAGEVVTFDPAQHMALLAGEAARIGNVRLVLVDPVVSAVRGDGNSNTEVRRALQPLVDLAAALRAAALGVSHFTKGSEGRDVAERVTGSLAFGAAPRVVLAAAKVAGKDGEPGGRIVVRAKCNIGEDSGGYRYDIEQVDVDGHPGLRASRVLWGEAVEGGARELLSEAEADREEQIGPREWLADYLRFGSQSAKMLYADATANGFSRDQINRAKRALGVLSEKQGMGGGWYWRLPEYGGDSPEGAEGTEDSAPRTIATFGATFGGEDGGAPEDGIEGGGHRKPPSSAPSAVSGRTWRITRADQTAFSVITPGAMTAEEVATHYAGTRVERLDVPADQDEVTL